MAVVDVNAGIDPAPQVLRQLKEFGSEQSPARTVLNTVLLLIGLVLHAAVLFMHCLYIRVRRRRRVNQREQRIPLLRPPDGANGFASGTVPIEQVADSAQ